MSTTRLAAIASGAALLVTLAAAPALASTGQAGAPTASTASASVAATTYKNCDALHKKYPHGVGKPGAKDKVSGKTKPVTTFTKNASVYNANKKSDRDGDGIACEKK